MTKITKRERWRGLSAGHDRPPRPRGELILSRGPPVTRDGQPGANENARSRRGVRSAEGSGDDRRGLRRMDEAGQGRARRSARTQRPKRVRKKPPRRGAELPLPLANIEGLLPTERTPSY